MVAERILEGGSHLTDHRPRCLMARLLRHGSERVDSTEIEMTTGYPDALRHRRQFLLGSSCVESHQGWQRLRVREGLWLTAHPDLAIRRVERGSRSITLLGFLFDSERPASSEDEILDSLLAALAERPTFADWVPSTYGLSGRWVLVLDDGTRVRLFSDPMGLRTVFYTDPACTGERWCATQPGLIARVLGLETDPVAISEYVDSDAVRAWGEAFFPADTTGYRAVRRVLANHVLDVASGECRRFWPDRPLGTVSLEAGAAQGAERLRTIMRTAATRCPLALGLSGGWDSRVLFAATRDIAQEVHYYTYSRAVETVDATVAGDLLSKFGLVQHRVQIAAEMTEPFAGIFRDQFPFAHEGCGRAIQALHEQLPAGRLNVTGNAAEITRVRFRLPVGENAVTARHLARFTSFEFADSLERIPFVVDAWQRWLDGLGNTHDVHVLDLFYWEHWGASFAGMDQTETDLAVDTLTPFNCRSLLALLLAIPEVHRDHDHPVHYELMIRRLWPEALGVPVNPKPVQSLRTRVARGLSRAGLRVRNRLIHAVVRLLHATGLYAAAKTLRDRVAGRRLD